MHTRAMVAIDADPTDVYRLAEDIESWPQLFDHYRWVRIQRQDERFRMAAMSAWRGPFPLRWVGLQERDPDRRRIGYRHVGGVTRGMRVLWRIDERHGGTNVTLEHWFRPRWLCSDWLVQRVIGELFVDAVAQRTLAQVKLIAEARAALGARQ